MTLGSERLVIKVRAMMPRISSISAAPKMALPDRVESLPISFKVSTVMLTDVAVNTTPINTFCKKVSGSGLKNAARKYPPKRGTTTPKQAMTKDALPDFFSSAISVSKPAVNINTMTPISAIWSRKTVSCIMPSIVGPSNRPATRAPTTWGMSIFLVIIPNTFVVSNTKATLNKNSYDSTKIPHVSLYILQPLFQAGL